MKYNKKMILILLLSFPVLIWADTGIEAENEIVVMMTNLVFQLGIIIFAARIGEVLFEKISMPGVLGQLLAGVIIGPYMLGQLSFLEFPHGLFPLQEGTIPISPELYGISTIASIMLLFAAGLETDFNLFLRFAFKGTIVGLGGIFASFIVGDLIAVWLIEGVQFLDPPALFMGVVSTATSVGITAKILSRRRSMDSPEGVTVLAGAVIDDVLGVILLAVVIGIADMRMRGGDDGTVQWGSIIVIGVKTIGTWLLFTVVGIFMSGRISKLLKNFRSKYIITVLAFGLALIMAGVFEKSGLAMIIGAYVMGLSFSNTDLSFLIQETLHPLERFFVPIFFTVMGMMLNVDAFMSKEVLILGFVYSLGAVLSKLIGSGIPALFLNFNKIGALRIGFGMAPRSEVALIIAGIGLSSGILNQNTFGACVLMPFITIIVATPILNILLGKKEKGVRKEEKKERVAVTEFKLTSPAQMKFFVTIMIEYFTNEGFFINQLTLDCVVYKIRKEDVFISLFCYSDKIVFKTSREDVLFIKTIVHESFLKLKDTIEHFNLVDQPRDYEGDISADVKSRIAIDITKILSKKSVIMDLQAETKGQAIEELIDILVKNGKLRKQEDVLKEVLAREEVMSTGMQNGFAIPHARTDGVDKVELALGFSREGIEFDSIDGKPTTIIVLLLSSIKENDPHIQVLAAFAAFLHREEAIQQLLAIDNTDEVIDFFKIK